jgi:hypothetical protein
MEFFEILFSSSSIAPCILGHFRTSPFSFVTLLKYVRSSTAKQLALHVANVCEWPSPNFIFLKHVFLHNFSLSFGVLSSVSVADGNEMSEPSNRVWWNLPPPELNGRIERVSSYVRVPRVRGIPLQSNGRYFRNNRLTLYEKIKLINEGGWTK